MSALTILASLLNEQKRFVGAAAILATVEPVARKTASAASGRPLASLLINLGKARAVLKPFEGTEAKLPKETEGKSK
jgi:hypothetical protein